MRKPHLILLTLAVAVWIGLVNRLAAPMAN